LSDFEARLRRFEKAPKYEQFEAVAKLEKAVADSAGSSGFTLLAIFLTIASVLGSAFTAYASSDSGFILTSVNRLDNYSRYYGDKGYAKYAASLRDQATKQLNGPSEFDFVVFILTAGIIVALLLYVTYRWTSGNIDSNHAAWLSAYKRALDRATSPSLSRRTPRPTGQKPRDPSLSNRSRRLVERHKRVT
jgi:hypothetical protein